MTSEPKVKIAIADLQYLAAEGLKGLLTQEGYEAIATGSRKQLLATLIHGEIEMLITDFTTFEYERLEEIKEIKEQYPTLKILILTNSISKSELALATKLGLKNISYKSSSREELLEAIETTLKGKKYFSDEVLDLILELQETKGSPEEVKNLSNSEVEVVKLIASGLTTKEIAQKRNVSFHTINTHRKNIFRKLEVTNASELIMQAIKAGWIDNIEYYI